MSAPIMLSDAERRHFATWLQQEAVTAEGIAEQLGKLSMSSALNATICARERNYADAARLIADRLIRTETM